ncbi:MAG: hypothetical protein HND44_01925 [Chloroflexi bacterium]|nr:YIP1 family protein [Ardenticatenaceae bacterium]MBL1127256.1 hypothetical protein [Chloroflexota bacterium]NOG33317.1 hypothetical protein [Chloroflexota bacterium]GIK56141.1 MAG: hypothetical protein BroJett015_18040 [Chloroflexota bacterium]
MKEKVIGALTMSADTYTALKADEKATTQALLVVIMAAICSAIGGGLLASSIPVGFGSLLLWAVVSWLLWADAVYLIGVKVFKGEATMSQVMRVLGFAYAPAAFNIFSFIPLMGIIIQFLVACWLVVSFYFATQHVLALSEGSKAAITVLVGWFIYLIGLGVVISFLGTLAGV